MEKNNALSITFVRGARTVTGSNFIVEARAGAQVTRIMVDCGLLQGPAHCDPGNAAPFPYDAGDIDALFVTHAHADHIGLVPKFVKNGGACPIYATAPTVALAPAMLADTAHLIVHEAEKCRMVPAYTPEDVAPAVAHMRAVEYGAPTTVGPVTIILNNAGHILGSATVLVEAFGTRILFTGDLGRTPAILVKDLVVPQGPIDYLVTESVYGDRTHDTEAQGMHVVSAAIARAQEERGILLIPSFSLERTQILMQELRTSPLPVVMDSPLAEKVTEVYEKFPEYLKAPLATYPMATTDTPPPKILLAGAGMSTGGRIRDHERQYLPDPTTTLLIVGYQVPGSLGRRLMDGAKEVMIDGAKVAVRATVMSTGGFSAHADRDDLLRFAEAVKPRQAFVVLGEMSAATFLAQRISGFLGIKTVIPQQGERYELDVRDH